MRAKTHDYQEKYWGHDYVWEPSNSGREGFIIGWGNGIRKGDFILLANGTDGSRYRFKSIEYKSDPPDMFSGELVFAPRSAAMKKRAARSK